MNRIYEFTYKWLTKFRDENILDGELTNRQFGDECNQLGFEMDCGESFRRVYGRAERDADELEKMLEDSQKGKSNQTKWIAITINNSTVLSLPCQSAPFTILLFFVAISPVKPIIKSFITNKISSGIIT